MKRKHKKSTQWRKWLRKGLIVCSIALGIFVLASAVVMWRFDRQQARKPEVLGVSFSQVQAERYGSDWRANYLAVLDELKFRNIRIMAYWNRIEQQPGKFDFSETDWMVAEAKKRGARISLALGQKVPRYPECFHPDWLDTKNDQLTSERAVKMVQAVAEHYKDEPTIASWQLDNEFLLKLFGECPKNQLNRTQLQKELTALKNVDSSRPIVLSQSNQWGMPVLGPFGDVFGFSLYLWVWTPLYNGYYHYIQPGEFNFWKAAWINLYTGNEIWVHEMQAEAWGPRKPNHEITYEEATKTMSPEKLHQILEYVRKSRIKRIDLWGAEWWYWLKETQGQPQMWNEVKKIMQSGQPS